MLAPTIKLSTLYSCFFLEFGDFVYRVFLNINRIEHVYLFIVVNIRNVKLLIGKGDFVNGVFLDCGSVKHIYCAVEINVADFCRRLNRLSGVTLG